MLLKFYRISDWIKNLGISLAGIIFASHSLGIINLLPLLQFFLAYAYAFSINDYFDFKIGKEKNFMKEMNSNYGKEKNLALVFSPLILLIPTMIFNSFYSLVFLISFLLFYSLYSIPPFRLKKNYLFSIPINSLAIGAFTFLSSYLFASVKFNDALLFFAVVFSTLIAVYEIIHQISHLNDDRRMKIKTLPIAKGVTTSVGVIYFIEAFVIIFAVFFLFMNFSMNFIFLGTILFSILRVFRISRWKKQFSNLRTKIFGFEEVLYYLIVLLIV